MKKQDIVRKCNVSRSTVYRILKKKIVTPGKENIQKINRRGGRPRQLTSRDERLLLRKIGTLRQREGSFTVKRLMYETGLDSRTVSHKTVQRFLHRNGYKYIQARRNGGFPFSAKCRAIYFCDRFLFFRII